MTRSDERRWAYEPREASVSFVLANAAVVAALIAACAGVSAWLARDCAPTATSFRGGAATVTGIERDWREQDAAVRAHLDRYDWIDRRQGLGQIPIERAMELVATPEEKSR